MARQLHFRCKFGGDYRTFRLTIGAAERLEQRCNAGVGQILQRLAGGYFRAADIPATLQHGLEGAGMPEADAAKIVDAVFAEFPIGDYGVQATAVLDAYINGVNPDLFDAEGKLKPANPNPETSPAGSAPGQESA